MKNKKIHIQQFQNSILKLHEDKLKSFKNKKKSIKEINDKITLLKNKKEKLKIDDYTYYKIEMEIKKLEDEKEYINSNNCENDYILKTFDIINKYNEYEEKKKILLDDTDEFNEELYEINNKQKELIDEYMIIYDPSYTGFKINYINLVCKNCNINSMETNNGHDVCYLCGWAQLTVENADSLSYQQIQEMDFRSQFKYLRESHLLDWIRRFTAKENKIIPQEVLDKVILEAKKEKIKDMNLLTEDKVKRYLKKLNLKNYYDNVISIINRINNRPAFKLTNEIEEKIKMMFKQIQEPFERHKPKTRKSMLSYSYILNKFFLILDLPEFSKYFTLLKSQEKLRQQDDIFKKIVEDMKQIDPSVNWRFFHSC